MSTAGTAGELGGGIAGGVIGGIIGSFIPPPGLGTLLGRAIGSRLGRMAGRAAGEMLNEQITAMEGAEEKAEEDTREAAAADVCTTCRPPKCDGFVEAMRSNVEKFDTKFKNYDPASDALGGHTYSAGGELKVTKPCSHHNALKEIQSGLRKRLEQYSRNKCSTNAPGGDQKVIDDARDRAGRQITVPPGCGGILTS